MKTSRAQLRTVSGKVGEVQFIGLSGSVCPAESPVRTSSLGMGRPCQPRFGLPSLPCHLLSIGLSQPQSLRPRHVPARAECLGSSELDTTPCQQDPSSSVDRHRHMHTDSSHQRGLASGEVHSSAKCAQTRVLAKLEVQLKDCAAWALHTQPRSENELVFAHAD